MQRHWYLVALVLLCGCGHAPSGTAPNSTIQPTIVGAARGEPTVVPTLIDPSARPPWVERFVRRDPCALPCWEGLTPGVTTRADAEALLPSLAMLDRYTLLPDRATFWLRREWTRDRGVNGLVLFDVEPPQRIKMIALTAGALRPEATWQQQIRAVYGEPESVMAFIALTPETQRVYYVLLFYPALGLTVEAIYYTRATPPRIDGTLDIETIRIEDPQQMLQQHWSVGVQYQLKHGAVIRPWEGDQSFDYYCAPKREECTPIGV